MRTQTSVWGAQTPRDASRPKPCRDSAVRSAWVGRRDGGRYRCGCERLAPDLSELLFYESGGGCSRTPGAHAARCRRITRSSRQRAVVGSDRNFRSCAV
jgi:hypothetical protein